MSNRPPFNRGKRPSKDHANYESGNDSHRSKQDGKLTDSHSKFRDRGSNRDRSPGSLSGSGGRGHGRFGHDRGSKENRPTSARGRDRDDGPSKRRDQSERDRRERASYSRSSKNDYSYRGPGGSESSARQNGSAPDVNSMNSGLSSREYVSSDFKRQTGMHCAPPAVSYFHGPESSLSVDPGPSLLIKVD